MGGGGSCTVKCMPFLLCVCCLCVGVWAQVRARVRVRGPYSPPTPHAYLKRFRSC
jgi:hypothetical protein